MADDLVSGLLAAIEQREKQANDCIAEVGSDRVGDEYTDGSGTADRDDFPSYPWGSETCELAYMAGPGHPSVVLRLCQAHREIVEIHRMDEHDGLCDECAVPAQVIVDGIGVGCKTLRALAEGYGIQEGSDGR